jgi:hypothetical protein
MAIKDKNRPPSSRKSEPEKMNIFKYLVKISDNLSFKHLNKLVSKNDTPQILALGFLIFIFYKAFPLTSSIEDKLFGMPYFFVLIVLLLIVLLIIIFLFNRKPKS